MLQVMTKASLKIFYFYKPDVAKRLLHCFSQEKAILPADM
jgi:hypothetical protein